MKIIQIAADVDHFYLDEVADLIAYARNGDVPEDVKYQLNRIQAEEEAHRAAKNGTLRVRHPGTHGPFPMELGIKRAVVLIPDLVSYLADYGIEVQIAEASVQDEKQTPEHVESVDFEMLATRQELQKAFGSFTGMDASWFTNLKDTPKLLEARRVAGSGGKDSTEPLFCPYAVMCWLIDSRRKKGRPLSEETGWRMLKTHFNHTYQVFAVGRDEAD